MMKEETFLDEAVVQAGDRLLRGEKKRGASGGDIYWEVDC